MKSRPRPGDAITPGERLVRRTGAGLALFTLALIATLLAVVGLVTAAAVAQMTDASVDSNLHTAAENMLIALAPSPTPTPAPTPTPGNSSTPTRTSGEEVDATSDTGTGDDSVEGGDGEGDETMPPRTLGPSLAATTTPRPMATPSMSPTATPRPSILAVAVPSAGHEDRPPESSDTFFLILDTAGNVVGNPQNVPLTDLPDSTAASIALGGADDIRTIDASGISIRLLSEPMLGLDGSVSGVLQTGFVLTAHEQQNTLIVQTIIVSSVIGLLGAAIVTLFVTRRAMAPIRAAFEAERRFIASASHELKTPVSVVRASAEILQRERLVKPEGRYLVDDVVAESDRMGRLVGDLLALASAEAGQISIHLTTFDLRRVVDEVVDRVQTVAAIRNVRVVARHEQDGGADQLLVRADRERMLQLLTIFIDNAIDHSPVDGVVTVVARGVDDGKKNGRRASVEVIDNGPGVPPPDRERIFEPFARAAGQRRTRTTTGLGLAIARLLAARQNATLSVGDAPGGGACFGVALPRATGVATSS